MKNRRRRKALLICGAAALALTGARFAWMRRTDKNAWPQALAGAVLEHGAAAADGAACAPEWFAAALTNMPPPDEALMAEYRRHQALGLSAAEAYPGIEARLAYAPFARAENWTNDWANGWTDVSRFAFDGPPYWMFDRARGSMPYNEFIGRTPELFVLAAYRFEAAGSPRLRAGWWVCAVETALRMTHGGGGGLIARHAALNNTMLMVRALIMSPLQLQSAGELQLLAEALRRMERALAAEALPDAMRSDLVSVRESVVRIHAGLGGGGGRIVRLLGGGAAQSRAHIDALFSHLLANAGKPYPHGIGAGMPAWCSGVARAPWTRDFVGASVAESYLRHAVFAAAVAPSLTLELRAARIASALEYHRARHGAYPESLGALIESGLLESGDIADPFAEGGAALSYARDGGGWRFWSAGLDQKNDGGLVNAFHATEGAARGGADFVFVSRERELRAAAWRAARR